MNRTHPIAVASLVTLLALTSQATFSQEPALDPGAIAEASGREATRSADGVVRIGWTRDDVPVTVDGMPLPPAAGLGSWAAFEATADGEAIVTGDTVVFRDEVDAAMDAAFAHGLAITALHNHFFFDQPKVYFMHIGGHGDARGLAAGVEAMWDAIARVREQDPHPTERFGGPVPQPGEGSIDPEPIGRITGLEPSVKPGGVVKVATASAGHLDGTDLGGSMGLGSWAAFSGSDELAAMDGDFAMTAAEVQPVLRALREAGIHVVALHNHMIGEQPGYFFVHFWAKGSTARLAEAFRAVLDAQAAAGSE